MKRKKRITFLIIIFFLLFSVSLPAQGNREIDSLQNLLSTEINDTTRIIILNQIGWAYLKINKDSSMFFANEALKENKGEYPKGLIRSYNTLGAIEYYKSDFYSAIAYYDKALTECYKIDSKKGIARTANNIGIMYKVLGNYNKSLEYNQQSLKIKQEMKDSVGIVISLLNRASLFFELNKFEEAIIHCEEALELSIICSNENTSKLLNVIGVSYTELGNYSKASEFLKKAYEINKENNMQKQMAINLHNLGSNNTEWGKYDQAMQYYSEALQIKRKIGGQRGIAKTEMGIGVLYYEMGDYNKCVNYLVSAEDFYSESEQIFELKSIYLHLAKAYYELDQISEAYTALSNSYEINDTLYTIESAKIIEELQTKYETEKKEKQIAIQQIELEKKQALNKLYVALLFAIGIALIIIGYLYRKKQLALYKLVEKNQELAKKYKSRPSKVNNNGISDKQRKLYKQFIGQIESDEIYRDKDLNLEKLSKILNTNRTEMSAMINKMCDTNYATLINGYRIGHAVRLLSDPKVWEKYSVEGIAMDSGFKSQSVFYKLFKEQTGLTPISFVKKK